MLSDLITRLTTPLAPPLRALGYLDETLAMRERARRNREVWKPHLENSRRFLLSAAERCAGRGKVLVLGSGLLLDVPLDELSELFREVVLADVVCLPEVRKRIARCPNVRFFEYDVTGLAEPLVHRKGTAGLSLPEPSAEIAESGNADLVVSLNILSQLWVVPRAFVAQQWRGVPAETVEDWCRRIVEAHYVALRGLSGAVCLIGDHAFMKRDRARNIISRGSTVYDLPLPGPDAAWTWNIVPIGKDSPHASKELMVGGWHFSKTSTQTTYENV